MTLTWMALVFAVSLGAVQSGAPSASVIPSFGAVIETPHVRVKAMGAEAPVAAGRRIALAVEVVPKPGMHVYAPEQKIYLPVSLRLDPSPGITARSAVFPKGERFFFAPTSETQIVYSRPFRIELSVTVAPRRTTAPLTLTGTLEYQACDDRVCYVPRKVPVAWTLHLQ